MTKFDIFVVNLRRSVDRREAMREKIAKIRGFKAIYIDDELVVQGKALQLNQIARSATLKALSGAGVGVVREGEGSDFAIQAPTPSLKKNARGQKGEFNADLSAESRKSIESESLESFRKRAAPPSPLPLRAKSCRFSLLGGEPRLSDSSKKSAGGTTAPFDSDFLHHESGEIRGASHDLLELHFHFFDATDAKDYNVANLPLQYSSKLTRFVKGKDLSFGEMACFSSHYRLWQKCVALDSPIIVLEDDIDFMQDFCQIVDIFKSPFEYVRLHYTMDKKTTHLRDNFYMSYDKVCGTLGYYLTPQAAKRFIKNAKFWLFCVDDYMDMFFIHSVKNIIFKPFIISEDLDSATQSTILGREKPKMRFYQKLTRELSRIYFFVIRKYLYFALHFVEIRAFFRAHKVAH